MSIYPNPAQDEFIVDPQGPVQDLYLLDACGRVVAIPYSSKGDPRVHCDVSAIAPGIYSLVMTSGHNARPSISRLEIMH